MSSNARALRGSCRCGRNQYVVRIPANTRDAQVVFDTDAPHRISSAAPLSAFIRVPLSWYHSRTFAFFPDETRSAIRRVYSEQHAMRHFCGFCGTPISYWSEAPRSEADYIQVTLGSLLTEDLHDLEDIGLVSDDLDVGEMDIVPTTALSLERQLIGREVTTIPWFDTMIQNSRLGNMRTTKGLKQSRDGSVRVEWEVTEWTEGDDDEDVSQSSATGKRKRGQDDNSAAAAASTSTG